jgi:hypothetical protein
MVASAVAFCRRFFHPGRLLIYLKLTQNWVCSVFKSLGLVIEDLVAANLAYRRARKTGRGTHVPL